MSTPNYFGRMEDDDGDDDSRSLSSCTSNNDRILAQIDGILTRSPSVPVNWNAVDGLLKELATDRESSPSSAVNKYGSAQNDPMGRLLMSGILSRNPPVNIVDATIHIFPDSLDQNPAAFLAASQKAGPEVLSRMARHISGRREQCNQCPYPWLLSNSTSVEQGKTILEAYPEGVLQPSPFLSSLDLVDHLLMVVESRTFDSALWTKFKLVLVAAGCSDKDVCSAHNCGIAPVQVILKRMLSRELEFWTNQDRVEHVLWLLHQLRWTDRWVFQKQSLVDGSFPIHLVLSRKCPTSEKSGLVAARALTQLLLEAYPASATHRVNGKLALHMAIENGWPCHDLLLAAHPESLDTPDPTTDLFPFQAAAKHHHNISASPISLDVTYELLRANPNHVTTSMGRGGTRRLWAQA